MKLPLTYFGCHSREKVFFKKNHWVPSAVLVNLFFFEPQWFPLILKLINEPLISLMHTVSEDEREVFVKVAVACSKCDGIHSLGNIPMHFSSSLCVS